MTHFSKMKPSIVAAVKKRETKIINDGYIHMVYVCVYIWSIYIYIYIYRQIDIDIDIDVDIDIDI